MNGLGKKISPPTNNAVKKFFHFLNTHGIGATVRKEMGADVNAACGQLKAMRTD